MQIINLTIDLRKVDENTVPRIGKFLSLFSLTYQKMYVTYLTDDLDIIQSSLLKDLFKVEKQISDFENLFIYDTFQVNASKLSKKWISYFNRKEIPLFINMDKDVALGSIKVNRTLLIKVNEGGDLLKLYDQYRIYHSSINFIPNDNKRASLLSLKGMDEQYINLFDKWLNDKEGVLVENIHPLLDASLGGSYRECYNDSCIGKRFFLDNNGNILTCEKECLNKYAYANIDDIKSLDEVYCSDSFASLLEGNINRRKQCASCVEFKKCQGGCSSESLLEDNNIETPNKVYCLNYLKVSMHIKETLNKLEKERISLKELNPSFKNILINSLKVDIRL